MDNLKDKQQRILIAGCNKHALSICVCLLKAAHEVTLLSNSSADLITPLTHHLQDLAEFQGEIVDLQKLNIISCIETNGGYDMAIAITEEDVCKKTALIEKLESHLDADVLIAINTESIALSILQQAAQNPERIIGANWAEPAHTTYFLEIITNENTEQQLINAFCNTAKELWNKDPYVIKSDKGIRSKMMCALVREAFYLIENNYVTVEDIDRACRNDAGYYLPFSGNFRYMDLMGTYMYGIVMQNLNPELSKNTHIPKFCQHLIENGSKGMANGEGFYTYESGEAEQWEETFRKFSYKI